MTRFRWYCVMLVLAGGFAQAEADLKAGEKKTAGCTPCHGPAGAGAMDEWPKLAGQHAGYLEKQLRDFREKRRIDSNMNPLTAELSDQDIADIAAYLSAQEANIGQAQADQVDLGKQIYRGGNPVTGVPACMACHGPDGAGNPAAGYAALSGQFAKYTQKQLLDYKAGTRKNDTGDVMQSIATQLGDTEIAAVSSYIEGLH